MALVRLDAVLLDAFGTLVSMEPPGPNLRAALAARGFEVSEDRAADAFRAEIAYYLDHHVEGRDERSLRDLRDRCASVLLAALDEPGLGLDDARAAMLEAIRFDAFEDAAPALRALRERGARLVVASNWDCSLPQVLAEAGLAGLVDGVVSSAMVGAAKPDRALFAAGLELARSSPERAVYVGDSPANDVGGAAAAGLRAVLLRRGGTRLDRVDADAHADVPPLAVIARLDELPDVI
jgi:putative hydrolase of the HAD superfamily